MARALFIGAHPDDIELGAGGTVAKLVAAGDTVDFLTLSYGCSARFEPEYLEPIREAEAKREAQAIEAGRILGVNSITILDFPDQRFDTVPILDIQKEIEARIRDLGPEVVYTHWTGDRNLDHRITADATMTACRPWVDASVRRLLAYNVRPQQEAFPVNTYEMLTQDQTEKREHALDCYDDEVDKYPRRNDTTSPICDCCEAEGFVLVWEKR